MKIILLLVIFPILLFLSSIMAINPLTGYFPILSYYNQQVEIPEITLINSNSPMYLQGYNQCGGYTTSFILNHYGLEAEGSKVYQELAYPLPFLMGIPPHRITSYFHTYGLEARMKRGSLFDLRYKALVGEPSIVLIGEGVKWQHYVVFLGYNSHKDEIYFYDPQFEVSERNTDFPGNRKINAEDFYRLWANGLPFFNHLFISITPANV